jgi:hypothetical protein
MATVRGEFAENAHRKDFTLSENALKFAQQCGTDGRSALQRKIDIFLDKRWVGPWPILCWPRGSA